MDVYRGFHNHSVYPPRRFHYVSIPYIITYSEAYGKPVVHCHVASEVRRAAREAQFAGHIAALTWAHEPAIGAVPRSTLW